MVQHIKRSAGFWKNSIKLQTDEEGQVYFGELKNIRQIMIEKNDKGYMEVFEYQLADDSLYHNLPSSFDILQGEGLKLPAAQAYHTNSKFFLYSVINKNVALPDKMEDCSSYLSLADGLLIISPELPKGTYKLYYQLDNLYFSIDINVRSGVRWPENPGYVEEKDGLLRLRNQNEYLIYNN